MKEHIDRSRNPSKSMPELLPRSVLIVDDEEALRMVLRESVLGLGHSCEVASNASEALERLHNHEFDLVISDIVMGDMNGIELMGEAQKSYPDLNFIIMTGHASEYSYSDIIGAGAADYLLKPFGMGELDAKLGRIQREEGVIRQLQDTNKRLESTIEQAKQMATQAEAASQAKGKFLANMSHELRTPLNAIIGFTDLILGKDVGDLNETQEDYLGDVLQSARYLLSLINNILDFSKIEAGKSKLELSEFDFGAVLSECMNMAKEKAVKHGIRLSTSIEELPETVRADQLKVKQIMHNLLSNAVKFTSDGGEVRMCARVVGCVVRPGLRHHDPEELRIVTGHVDQSKPAPDEDQTCIEVSVSDTGIGLEPKDMAHIFNPFEQAGDIADRGNRGSGLGLSLTKRLVELHGGKIWAESEGAGKGSTFRFIVPVQGLASVPRPGA